VWRDDASGRAPGNLVRVAEKTTPQSCRSFSLVLNRMDPHLGAMVGASGNCQVEAVEAFLALSKIPRGTRPYRSLNFRQKLVVIGIILLEHADVAFSAGNINALACRVVIQIVQVLDSRCASFCSRPNDPAQKAFAVNAIPRAAFPMSVDWSNQQAVLRLKSVVEENHEFTTTISVRMPYKNETYAGRRCLAVPLL
jgi:hypothetical protein